jgi:hypothetical protein
MQLANEVFQRQNMQNQMRNTQFAQQQMPAQNLYQLAQLSGQWNPYTAASGGLVQGAATAFAGGLGAGIGGGMTGGMGASMGGMAQGGMPGAGQLQGYTGFGDAAQMMPYRY